MDRFATLLGEPGTCSAEEMDVIDTIGKEMLAVIERTKEENKAKDNEIARLRALLRWVWFEQAESSVEP